MSSKDRCLRGPPSRGSVSVEVAILAPAFLLLIVAATGFGRTAVAAHAIDVAAHDAARAASISRTAPAAAASAETAATEALDRQGLDCAGGPTVVPDVRGFAETDRELAFVSVSITCVVSLTGAALPGVPRTAVLSTSFASPIDTFRERP